MNPYLRLPLRFNFDQLAAPMWGENILIDVMLKLSHRMQVICSVMAAEMVLPIWEQQALGSPSRKPRELIGIIHRWLRGAELPMKDIKELARHVEAVPHSNNLTAFEGAEAEAAYAIAQAGGTEAAYAIAQVGYIVASSRRKDVAYLVRTGIMYAVDAAGIKAVADAEASGINKYENVHLKASQQFYQDWWNQCKPLLVAEEQRWSDWAGGVI